MWWLRERKTLYIRTVRYSYPLELGNLLLFSTNEACKSTRALILPFKKGLDIGTSPRKRTSIKYFELALMFVSNVKTKYDKGTRKNNDSRRKETRISLENHNFPKVSFELLLFLWICKAMILRQWVKQADSWILPVCSPKNTQSPGFNNRSNICQRISPSAWSPPTQLLSSSYTCLLVNLTKKDELIESGRTLDK